MPEKLKELIRDIPDYPKPGILFRDITPLLANSEGLRRAVDLFVRHNEHRHITHICGMESRGFLVGTPLAVALGVGFIPVRKRGKLPAEVYTEAYELEYGVDHLEIHRDALDGDSRVLVVDDLLATGGTAAATLRLINQTGAHIVGFDFLIELEALGGRAQLAGHDVFAVITY